LKSCANRRAEYFRIAADHTPANVRHVEVLDEPGNGYAGMAHLAVQEGDADKVGAIAEFSSKLGKWPHIEGGKSHPASGGYSRHGWIEAPVPNTLARLWVFLHECQHMALHSVAYINLHTRARTEAEAELGVLRIFEAEKLILPFVLLKARLLALIWTAQTDQIYGAEPDSFIKEVVDVFLAKIREKRA